MLKCQNKLTLAAIVTRTSHIEAVRSLEQVASTLCKDWEILLVACDISQNRVMELTRIARGTPDATLHILEGATRDMAQLAILDMAVGDRVLTIDLDRIDVAAARAMLELSEQGFDVVLGETEGTRAGAWSYRVMRRLFMRLYRYLSGVQIGDELPRMSLYSRPAALHLLQRREAEMLLRTTQLSDAFPGTHISVMRSDSPAPADAGDTRDGFARAYRALNFAGALPLRLVVLLSGLSAIVNVMYMKFAVISHLFEENIAPGWTTLSLQISGMFLLLCIILGIVAEHLIAVDRAVNRRPRYRVLREVRSPLSKAWEERNVTGTY